MTRHKNGIRHNQGKKKRKSSSTFKVATWNTQGLSNIKCHFLLKDLFRFDVDIAGIQETYRKEMEIERTATHTLYHFGMTENMRTGIAIVVKKEIERHVQSYIRLSDRIGYVYEE